MSISSRWNKASARRKTAIIASSLLAGVTAAALLIPTTGAWQSDTLPGGHLHGNGAILSGESNDTADFTFNNQQPGIEQSHTFTVTNTGTVANDAWLTFNKTALSTLNTLGTYGHFKVDVTRGGVTTTLFESINLNDRSATCGAFSPTGCNPVPNQLLLASNLDVPKNGNPGETITVTEVFNYAGKMVHVPPTFNTFPLPGGAYPANPNGQVYINAADGNGEGLPYQVSLMQTGHSPS